MEEGLARGGVPKSAKVLGMKLGLVSVGSSEEESLNKGVGMEPGLVFLGNVDEGRLGGGGTCCCCGCGGGGGGGGRESSVKTDRRLGKDCRLGMEPGLVAVGNVPERKLRSGGRLIMACSSLTPTSCFSV